MCYYIPFPGFRASGGPIGEIYSGGTAKEFPQQNDHIGGSLFLRNHPSRGLFLS